MAKASSKACSRRKHPKNATVAGFSASKTAEPGDWFDDQEWERIRAFFGALTHQKGEFAGKPFTLLPWQEDYIATLLCWKRADGKRRFRECYTEIGRKNGKTTLMSAICLWMLVCDSESERGAEIYCCASTRDQAAVCGDSARQMIQSNAALSKFVTVYRNVATYRNSKLEILSSDAGAQHGKNPSCIVFDELHTYGPNGRDLYDAMATGQGSRSQPLKLCITTAGSDRNSLCYELHQLAEKVRDGLVKNHQFLPVLFGAPVDADWTSPKVWKQANPSLGVTISEEFLASECAKALELPSYQNTFRTLYLNQWVESKRAWIGFEAWAACASKEITEEALAGRECWAGLDLSTTKDLTSLSLVFPSDDGFMDVYSYSWCPEEGIRRRSRSDRAPYDVWSNQGWLRPTPGPCVDYDEVARFIRNLCKRFDVKRVAFDPWGATQLATGLLREGVPMIEVRQGFRSLSEPSKKLEALVLSKKLRHPDNPLLNWAVSNTVIDQDTDAAGNIKPSKASSTERIDPVAALVSALAGWMFQGEEHTAPSIYETKELEWL